MVRGLPLIRRSIILLAILLQTAGCALVPRSRLDECQRLGKTLRSENARLKDQILAAQSQNRDLADRAVDDARRLATQDEAISRLEHSVQAYQDDRDRLESAFSQLTANLRDLETRSEDRAARTDSRAGLRRNGESQAPAARPKADAGQGDADGKQ
jgi:chromosome segregation ATPase